MATFYDSFAQGMQNGLERQKAVTQRNMLAELQQLAPKVIAGDLSATDRAFALDPKTAQFYQAEGNRQQDKLVGLAKSLTKFAGNPQMQAGIYRSAVPYLKRSFGAEIPDEFDAASVMPIVDQVLAVAAGRPTAQGEQFTLSPGSKRFDATGNVVAEAPFAPTNADVIDVPDGRNGSYKMVWDPRTRQLSPLPGARGGNPTAGTSSAGATVFRAPNGELVDIEQVTEPAVRESILRNPEEWGLVADGSHAQLPDRSVSPTGALGYTPPKPQSAPSGYTYQGDSLVPIPGGPADNSSPQAVASGEQSLRKEVTQNLKDDQGVLSMYRNVQSAASRPSAAGDLSLIFAFMKMLDPGSVVREQEFANAQNAAGVPDQVRNAYNKAISGQRLNPTQRQDFLNQAAQLATNAEGRITGTTRKYQEIARQYGYDPVRGTGMADFSGVTGSVSRGPEPAAGPARPQTDADFKALPSGSLYIDPDDGRTYRKR
ncbi:hypothetical protein [Stenotrophomonas maltophilia]|uniref:hypothetical protein n=1 Tax=Stenotrophomonas maltophilia TaxID=40324 RepID=UPI0013128194|nr:hypothetical protein [Stenotrophomonas maltophilia]MCO7456843.1 hypothetical protein [Stenotrophomonas maltophilia]MCO7465256.1 hypothetical protein [Stenotrophomonas maltophilia]MCO7483081.1 hypothetical protein [Stenotrophomonas maltophilia]MCO7491955.1 hypothetical protein [Stenotrophomonas maltophilia]